jgi:tetratricopeptide (TPR) repeat protein
MTRANLSTAEKLISRFPWYTLGYVDVYEEICRIDPESAGLYLGKAAARVYSREHLYEIFKRYTLTSTEEDSVDAHRSGESLVDMTDNKEASENSGTEEVRSDEIGGTNGSGMDEIELDEIDFVPDDMPRFVLAGGDYFSRKELDQLELDKKQPLDHFIAEKPTLLRGAVQGKQAPAKEEEVDVSDFFDDASFYTETLANIYTEQGFYKRAIDVYAKLILLYPEKSSYFASLVKELKEKYNI